MSLSRSPSPNEDGGWSSPGLTVQYADTSGHSSPANALHETNGNAWVGTRKKATAANGYPAFATQNNGFFKKHIRNISHSLPSFKVTSEEDKFEKKPRSKLRCLLSKNGKLGKRYFAVAGWAQKHKKLCLSLLAICLMWILFVSTRKFICGKKEISEADRIQRCATTIAAQLGWVVERSTLLYWQQTSAAVFTNGREQENGLSSATASATRRNTSINGDTNWKLLI